MESVFLWGTVFLSGSIVVNPLDIFNIISIVIILVLLVFSALISGSEIAYFSLSPNDLKNFSESNNRNDNLVQELNKNPEKLLATILITNNFVNVGIVIISTFLFSNIFDFSELPVVGFIIQVVLITFLLLLFGEIIPKVYASQFAARFAAFMAYPLFILRKIFSPLSHILINSTSFINKHFQKKSNLSIDDLSDALDITENQITEDKSILKGIVRFGNIDVKEIMKSRVDVTAVESSYNFNKIVSVIIETGFSRIPVYENNFDNIKGILYIKDLLPHLKKDNNFKWQKLLRKAYFVPETKKINDLLEEFQSKKNHMAIVVDEYGGTSGIITLEDIIEEIVGEINDEVDDENISYKKIDDNNYIFEGKTLLNDFYKITNCKDEVFDDIKGDSETLAGLILEYKGEIPFKNEVFKIKNFTLTVKSVDNRRIKQIGVKID